jgi:hypothetical protein
MLAGQVIVGGCVSFTVTVNEHEAGEGSVQLTVVTPTEKNEPEGGMQVTVPHDPVVSTGGYVTFAPHWFVVFDAVTSPGQTSVQAPPTPVIEMVSMTCPSLPFVESVPTRHRSTML